jgi:FkbM family methyltransferase
MVDKLHIGVGELCFRGDNEPYVRVEKGQIGCVLFGPYQYFPSNKYEVKFDILLDDGFVPDGEIFCHVDVVHDFGAGIIDQAAVNSRHFVHNGMMSIALPFSIDRPMRLEFRLHSLGTQPFIARYERIVTIAGRSDEKGEHSKFYNDNINQFRKYSYLGAKITPLSNGVIVDWMDVKLLVNNVEYFQLINEILCSNIYKFSLPRDACVIDVGMNAGVASLYFARMPAVRVVHAFEPFSRPFARALDNFALNPELSLKIRPNQAGLAGMAEVLEVTCSEDQTIGTSIRGRGGSGTALEKISLRDASEALRPLIQEAIRSNQAVVVKLDCEGSEFSIIESLDRTNLLKHISIFMVEWHAWWSKDKSNKSIVEPLSANGFFVFDLVRVDDIYGSMIYSGRP